MGVSFSSAAAGSTEGRNVTNGAVGVTHVRPQVGRTLHSIDVGFRAEALDYQGDSRLWCRPFLTTLERRRRSRKSRRLTMRLHGSAFICTTLGLALAACSSGGGSTSSTTAGSVAGSGSAAGSSSGGPTSSGSASGSGPTSSGTGGAASSSGGASSTGGVPVFVDGGYVFCSMAFAADAGPDGDGGPANWLCPPGTYVCDLSGNIGNCFQCQSDSDCANPGLPTYDPARPHCDLTSGVPGYQSHCQQCTKNADCTGNPAGSFCDSSPTYPANASQPPIVD